MEEEAMLQKGMCNKDSKEEHAVLKKKKKGCQATVNILPQFLILD